MTFVYFAETKCNQANIWNLSYIWTTSQQMLLFIQNFGLPVRNLASKGLAPQVVNIASSFQAVYLEMACNLYFVNLSK